MAQNHDQFTFVLEALRERLRTRAGVRGEPLTVNDLASTWGVSATPVREALAHLAGEGLIEDRLRRGYYAWRLDVSDLTDLYRAQKTLTMTALADLVARTAERAMTLTADALSPPSVIAPLTLRFGGADAILFWEAVTWRIASEAGHRFFLNLQQRLSDRLAPARQMEPSVLLEDGAALSGLADMVNRRDWRALSADIEPFFARRLTGAGAIVEQLRANPKVQ